MWRNVLIGGVFVVIVGGTVAGSNKSDAEKLTRVGKKVADKVTGAMPDTATIAGPLAAMRSGEWLSVEERVRVRLRTDKVMDGSKIIVVPEGSTVRLRGEVLNLSQSQRALELAQSTAGVEKVILELALVDGK